MLVRRSSYNQLIEREFLISRRRLCDLRHWFSRITFCYYDDISRHLCSLYKNNPGNTFTFTLVLHINVSMYRYLHLKGFHFQLLSWASVVDDVHSLYKSSGAALAETFSHAASLLKDALTLADYLLVGNSNNLSTQNYHSIRNQVWLPCTCGLSTSLGRGLLGRGENK